MSRTLQARPGSTGSVVRNRSGSAEVEDTQALLRQANVAPATLRPAQLLQLQRAVGNRTTAGLLQRNLKPGLAQREEAGGKPSLQPAALQRSSAPAADIQRTLFNPKANSYYSNVLEGQKITQDNAVFTATAFDGSRGGGHSSVYIERLSAEGKPQDFKVHLTYDAKAKFTKINIQPGYTPREDETKRRSWVRSSADADNALEKAQTIANEPQEKKKYRLLGGSLTRGGMNCAKFAERILKAAGIKASAGLIFKTPTELATGKNKGYTNTLEEDTQNYQQTRKEELEKQRMLLETQQKIFGVKKEKPVIPQVQTNPLEAEWLTTAVGTDFQLVKGLPAIQSNKGGGGKRETINLPAGAHILVTGDGQTTGEVVIECIQPRGYYVVTLPLLYDAAPHD